MPNRSEVTTYSTPRRCQVLLCVWEEKTKETDRCVWVIYWDYLDYTESPKTPEIADNCTRPCLHVIKLKAVLLISKMASPFLRKTLYRRTPSALNIAWSNVPLNIRALIFLLMFWRIKSLLYAAFEAYLM